MIGYKVVRQNGFLLTSATRNTFDEDGVYYFWHIPIKHKEGCGPLSVFNTERSAREFARISKHFRIFEVDYKPSSEMYVWDLYDKVPLALLPCGSRLADELIITREVSRLWRFKRWLKYRWKSFINAIAAGNKSKIH